MRIPVTTSPQAQVIAALGAELIAGRDPEEEAVTLLADAPVAAPVAAAPLVPPPLAWSAEDGTDDLDSAIDEARPEILFDSRDFDDGEPFAPLPWYRRPGVLFGAAACFAVVASIGFILTVRTDDVSAVPAGSAGTSASVTPPGWRRSPWKRPRPPRPSRKFRFRFGSLRRSRSASPGRHRPHPCDEPRRRRSEPFMCRLLRPRRRPRRLRPHRRRRLLLRLHRPRLLCPIPDQPRHRPRRLYPIPGQTPAQRTPGRRTRAPIPARPTRHHGSRHDRSRARRIPARPIPGTTDPGTTDPGSGPAEPGADEPECVPEPGAAC